MNTYDTWLVTEMAWKCSYGWCQFCSHNNSGHCELHDEFVDDDGCCNECTIDSNKVNALPADADYFRGY